ncbi:hypothetical protein B0H14DRAFT_2845865 [Mycena olivaceomarginata]|nr:hypothetical protein B0H14DRAFT_2845865 [Mycena olivaceomarginata]
MAPAATAPRKRTRKRKRRALSVSSSSSSSSSSDSESEVPRALLHRGGTPHHPPPPSGALPTFIPPLQEDAEQLMKARFKKFWMASVADGFKDDLEEIRVKEPNLGSSRLGLLIDSLASGADVFSSTADINEMQVVLE